MDWDAFKIKTANLTTASPMLMMQRRNVNWVIKPKNQVRKTWGVTHVLLIMEEVLLSEVHDMEKLVEVGVGGVWRVGVFWLSQLSFPDPSVTFQIILSIFLIGSQFSLIPPLNSVSDHCPPSPFPLKTMIFPPKTLPPLPPPLSKSNMVTYFLLLISAFQSSVMSRVHPRIIFPERIWS